MTSPSPQNPPPLAGGPSSVASLKLRGLGVGYEGKEILSGIDLALEPGEVWLMRGPNGSGKTTFLRTVAGLIPPIRGEIDHPPGLHLSYVPAEGSLSPALPLRIDEVAMMGALRLYPAGFGWPSPLRKRAHPILERLGLWAKRRQAFNRSSSGERQRTLLARALMAQPHILLMDEPTSNLDQESLKFFMAMLHDLHAESVGMVVSTHVHDQFADLRPRFLELRNGMLVPGSV